MAFDVFVEFGRAAAGNITVTGESTDAAFPNQVQLQGFSFGAENTATIGAATSGAGAGKATFTPIVLHKAVDNASPQLFQVLVTGAHFEVVRFRFRRAGGGAEPFFVLEAKTVIVADYELTASGDVPTERIVLQCGAVQLIYRRQDPSGKLGQPNQVIWSVVQNKAAF